MSRVNVALPAGSVDHEPEPVTKPRKEKEAADNG